MEKEKTSLIKIKQLNKDYQKIHKIQQEVKFLAQYYSGYNIKVLPLKKQKNKYGNVFLMLVKIHVYIKKLQNT